MDMSLAGVKGGVFLSTENSRIRKPRSLAGDVARRLVRHRFAVLGLTLLACVILLVAVGPVVYTVSPKTVDFSAALEGPSRAHPLGTNDLGQDTLARIMYGGRVSLTVGLAAMIIALLIGTTVGALSGYYGGATDSILMRLTDVFLALPQLPLLLLVIYLFRDPLARALGAEAGTFVIIVATVGALSWMSLARLVRANFLTLRESEFITAANATGVTRGRVILRHLLPNTVGPIIVASTLLVGTAIIAESSLSFLGLGFPPDTPTWGRMLFDAQNYLEILPIMALAPGFFIFITVFSINYLGDGLRDAFDPQLRSR